MLGHEIGRPFVGARVGDDELVASFSGVARCRVPDLACAAEKDNPHERPTVVMSADQR
jgi:hypothetical protein